MASRSIRSQWTNAIIFAATAGLWFVLNRTNGGGGSIVVPVVLLIIAVISSPIFKRTSVSHDAALAAGDDVVIYHRPGCTYCIRMKAALGPLGKQATWVDIWEDDDAAEFVRSVNGGNETVPTVMINGRPNTNPSPGTVRAALTA